MNPFLVASEQLKYDCSEGRGRGTCLWSSSSLLNVFREQCEPHFYNPRLLKNWNAQDSTRMKMLTPKLSTVKPGQMLRIRVLVKPRPIPLYTAKEADTWNPTVETVSDEKNAKAIAACLYARLHRCETDSLIRFILPARFNDKNGAKLSLLKTLISAVNQYQTNIMKFYRVGVRLAVTAMGGLKVWKATGTPERVRMFGNYSTWTHWM